MQSFRRSLVEFVGIIFALVLAPDPAQGITRYVALAGSSTPPYTNLATAATNIQLALNAANAGDEVLVAAGLYLVSVPVEMPIAKTLTLRSTQSRAAIIDAQHLGRGLIVWSTNSLVEGFTIRNGFSASYGGGVCMYGPSTMQDCLVTSNQAWGAGGVMFQANGAVVKNSTIQGNVAAYFGGGVIFYNHTTGLVDTCIISGNTASNYGGGVSFQFAGVVSNSWIADNTTSNYGGGVYFQNGGVMVNSVLVGNRSQQYAGGFYSTGGYMAHCTVVSNSAAQAYGGAYMQDSTSWNNIVYFNTAPLNENLHIVNSVVSNCCTTPALGGSNFTNAPTFVNLGGRDFHLAEVSSCIDAGATNPAVARDYDGALRPQAGTPGGAARYDVGAFEAIPVIRQTFASTQSALGTANRDWSFMTAWNLSTGLLEISPTWYNGSSTFVFTLSTANQWLALFLYDEGTAQTRELRWNYRQLYVH